MVDAFRILYPRNQEFTFFRPGCAASRLDRVYLSQTLLDKVDSIQHISSLSDHCGVLMGFNYTAGVNLHSKKSENKASYWKLNTAILREDTFSEYFLELWENLQVEKQNFSDVDLWWESEVKPKIKEFCMAFSKDRIRKRNDS